MDTIKIAFFKAEYGGFDDKVIDLVTGRQGYSHCEVVLGSSTTIGSHALYPTVAKYRYKNILEDRRWTILTVPVKYRDAGISYAEAQIGRTTYDMLGVTINALLRIPLDSREKVWCSELCAKTLAHAGVYKVNPLAMPNALYEQLKSMPDTQVYNSETLQSSRATGEVDIYGRIGYATK